MDSIFSALIETNPEAKENVTESLLSKLICAVYPNAKKSSVREADSSNKRKTSFKGLGINVKKYQGAELSFKDLQGLVPPDWFLISKTDNIAVFGKLSEEYFNGNPILFRIEINPTGECSLFVGDTRINLREYFVEPHIKFYAWSVSDFFKCIDRTLRLCCGHDSSRTLESTVGVTETFTHSKEHCKKNYNQSCLLQQDRFCPVE